MNPTPRERLLNRKRCLERELGDVKAALEALDDNPQTERVLTSLSIALGGLR